MRLCISGIGDPSYLKTSVKSIVEVQLIQEAPYFLSGDQCLHLACVFEVVGVRVNAGDTDGVPQEKDI